MIWFVMLGLSVVLLMLYWQEPADPLEFIQPDTPEADTTTRFKALNMSLLTDEPLKARLKIGFDNFKARVGKYLRAKLALFMAAALTLTVVFQPYLPVIPWPGLFLLILLVTGVLVIKGLQVYERKQFDASFPNALNMLSGAVSSGESLMHAIIFVGNSLPGVVGEEFKLMGQRLSMGQAPDEVLRKTCRRFPYAPFYFFVITLRANISRGGAVKRDYPQPESGDV